MAGPKEQEAPASEANPAPIRTPPGHFLNSDLQSDTARFLAELKESHSPPAGDSWPAGLGASAYPASSAAMNCALAGFLGLVESLVGALEERRRVVVGTEFGDAR